MKSLAILAFLFSLSLVPSYAQDGMAPAPAGAYDPDKKPVKKITNADIMKKYIGCSSEAKDKKELMACKDHLNKDKLKLLKQKAAEQEAVY